MTKNIIILIIIFALTSCVKTDLEIIQELELWRTYTIESGNHSCDGPNISNFSRKTLSFEAIFNESCKYTINNSDQSDINKLYGFSNGINHMTHSARFGWRWYKNNLEIFAYTHVNGDFHFKYITKIDLDKVYEYKIELRDDIYIFTCNNDVVEMESSGKGLLRYYLYPYFGGNATAPHQIKINIREIN